MHGRSSVPDRRPVPTAFVLPRRPGDRSRVVVRTALPLLVVLFVFPWVAQAQTVSLSGTVVDMLGQVLPGAVVMLLPAGPRDDTSPDVPILGSTVANDVGEFTFDQLPPDAYTILVDMPGYSRAEEGPIVLAAADDHHVVVRLDIAPVQELVTVEATANPSGPADEDLIGADVLAVYPLPTDRFQEALPLLPGVVRDSRGRLSFNGSRPSQSTLLVNGTTATDPVTGEFAMELPLKAIDTVQVFHIPYSAEFGRVTGAVASVTTTPGDDEWTMNVGSVWPSLRVRNGKLAGINSATPRVQINGPLVTGRAWLAQGLSYDFVRSRVYDMPEGVPDESVVEGFDTFTQLDLRLADNHALTTTLSLFPQETEHYGLDTLHSASASPELVSDGWNVAVADRVTTESSALWETGVAVRRLDVTIRPEGQGRTRLTPSGLDGNYFNETERLSTQVEVNVSRAQSPALGMGRHVVKVGTNFYYTKFDGVDRSSPIDLFDAAGRRLRSIEFQGEGVIDGWDVAFGTYVQDHWQVSNRLGVDLGVRYDYERITDSHHIAPRIAAAYSFDDEGTTVIRGGWGRFFDQVFLHAASYERFQDRIEQRFGSDGALLGPAVVYRHRVDGDLSVPRSTVWNIEMDRALTEDLSVRVNYRQQNGDHQFLVEPVVTGPGEGLLRLSSSGTSTSREFDVTARWQLPREGRLFISFSKARATGDLNEFGTLYGNLRDPLVLENERSILPLDVPERILVWGIVNAPWDLIITPAVEWRQGFPFTTYAEDYTAIGERNRGGRFPRFLSADVQVTKGVRLFGRSLRVGFQVFNLTARDNPRDVVSNVGSPDFGVFRNGAPLSFGLRIEIDGL